MFIRKNKNRSGSVSIQIVSKANKKYKVVKSFGSATSLDQIRILEKQARLYLDKLEGRTELFTSPEDVLVESFVSQLDNTAIQVIGPELIFGRIYDYIGYNKLDGDLFRHLVLTRLFHPGSKLKAIDYLKRYQNIDLSIDSLYRYLDKIDLTLKQQIEDISFKHVKRALNNKIGIVFYDMTTLHFESGDEDDLRKTGFSKVGKHQNPQIYL